VVGAPAVGRSAADKRYRVGVAQTAAAECDMSVTVEHCLLTAEEKLLFALDAHVGSVAAAVDQHELVAPQFDFGMLSRCEAVTHIEVSVGRPAKAHERLVLVHDHHFVAEPEL
ncbi:hypothetical protein RZS08_49135, partial [Arthrospira platensis SPKY1]|nr:hypothetical protein [Arthrospira platensis SPKY1]